MSRLRCVTGIALALSLASSRALAEPSAQQRETARNLMNEGEQRRAAGDLFGARERFAAAHAIMNVPTTAFELARVQAQTQQLVDARSTALDVANLPVQPNEPRAFSQARAEAAKLALDLAPRVPDVSVTIAPQTATGRMSIDGIEMPRALQQLPIKLNPGAHVLSVEAPGYAAHTQHFTLAESEHAALRATLTPAPDLAPAPAEVASAQPVAPPPAASAFQPYPAARTRGFVALTFGTTVLAAGIATGILSAVQTGNAQDMCDGTSCPESAQDEIDLANTLAIIANISIPVGALAAGYGLFEILTHPYEDPPQASTTAGIRVSMDLAHLGITLRGAL